MIPDLIYDVGFHNGNDTAYYLSQGYRVVAIEANPLLAEAGRARFADEIAAGSLIFVDAGIAASDGEATFWVNEERSEWSAFIREVGCRQGTPCRPVVVPTRCFGGVIAEYGVPHYLKIDIENNDIHCLTALTPDDLPAYVSVEAHRLEYLAILASLGYSGFKCIDQLRHNSPLPRQSPSWWSGARSWLANNRVTSTMLRPLLPIYRRARRHDPRGPRQDTVDDRPVRFPAGSSGPFGDATPGDWVDLEHVAYEWLHVRFRKNGRGTLNASSWFDFHARLAPSDPVTSPDTAGC